MIDITNFMYLRDFFAGVCSLSALGRDRCSLIGIRLGIHAGIHNTAYVLHIRISPAILGGRCFRPHPAHFCSNLSWAVAVNKFVEIEEIVTCYASDKA